MRTLKNKKRYQNLKKQKLLDKNLMQPQILRFYKQDTKTNGRFLSKL